MTQTIEFSYKAVTTESGRTKTYTPALERAPVSISGEPFLHGSIEIPLLVDGEPVPDPTLIWDFSLSTTPVLIVAQLRGGVGFVYMAWKHDIPVSATDLSASGTAADAQGECLSGHAPFIKSTVFGRTHTTIGTRHGFDGDGFPSVMTSAASVDSRLYALWCQNRSYVTPATLEYWVFA